MEEPKFMKGVGMPLQSGISATSGGIAAVAIATADR